MVKIGPEHGEKSKKLQDTRCPYEEQLGQYMTLGSWWLGVEHITPQQQNISHMMDTERIVNICAIYVTGKLRGVCIKKHEVPMQY